MAPDTIRKAIGAVKDQTSIRLAKVAGNKALDLEVLVVKATTHDDEPADEKYVREILSLISCSRSYVAACVAAVSKRLSKTHDWIVALKALILVHQLLVDRNPQLCEEIANSAGRGLRILNMADFRVEAQSKSWDHAGFVRVYAMYLEEKVELEVSERKDKGRDKKFEDGRRDYREIRDEFNRKSRYYGDLSDSSAAAGREKRTLLKELKPERVLTRYERLLRILDRVLACRPSGSAKSSRLIIVAFNHVVRESFGMYVEICETLGLLLDRFTHMEYGDSVKGFDAYVSAAKMIDGLVEFYGWCKDTGIARSSEYPQVQKIADQLLAKLEGFLKETRNGSRNRERNKVEKKEKPEPKPDINEVKPLPPPKNFAPPPPEAVREPPKPQLQKQSVMVDLLNLSDDDERRDTMAVDLFSGPTMVKTAGSREAFPSDGGTKVKSAWQTSAGEIGNNDWESALMKTSSNLSKQKAEMGGGLDPLLLNGMYDMSSAQLQSGSASSTALPGLEKTKLPVLALPASNGTVQPVGPVDPFAASLTVPPPSYVQKADMERKQQLLVQEQQAWQQYGRDGMHGQVGLAKAIRGLGYYGPMLQQDNSMGLPGGYYYTPPY